MITAVVNNILSSFGLEYKYGQIQKRQKGLKYHKAVLSLKEGNACIKEQLADSDSVLIARIGLTELKLLLNYLHFKNRPYIKWHDAVKEQIWKHSGIFPSDNASLKKFAIEFLDAIKEIDVVGVWNNEGESEVVGRFCKNSTLIPLESIEPYFFEDPWSKQLEGKKVLVIHPFEKSIQYQYQNNREKLFKDRNVLPLFELKTVKAVQALIYNATSFNNWMEVYEYTKQEIDKKDFDVAIVAAGGYGLLIGAYIKSLGKKAIHMGGATQILFGVKGKRWEDRKEFKGFFNQFWKHPYEEERPENAQLHENGAYW